MVHLTVSQCVSYDSVLCFRVRACKYRRYSCLHRQRRGNPKRRSETAHLSPRTRMRRTPSFQWVHPAAGSTVVPRGDNLVALQVSTDALAPWLNWTPWGV